MRTLKPRPSDHRACQGGVRAVTRSTLEDVLGELVRKSRQDTGRMEMPRPDLVPMNWENGL